MAMYMLSTHAVQGDDHEQVPGHDAEAGWARLQEVEDEMRAGGAWVFSGRLHDPATATVVRASHGDLVTTDGPFVEAKEHIAGFYLVEAPDLDAALGWAGKVTACIGAPIEVWPFADTAQ